MSELPPDVAALATRLQDETTHAANAMLALMEATDDEGPMPPLYRDGFDAGVQAGFISTMEMLLRYGLKPETLDLPLGARVTPDAPTLPRGLVAVA